MLCVSSRLTWCTVVSFSSTNMLLPIRTSKKEPFLKKRMVGPAKLILEELVEEEELVVKIFERIIKLSVPGQSI